MGSVLTKTRRVFDNGYHADVCACVCVCLCVRVRARACLSTCVHVSARGEQWMGPFGECLEPIVCRAVSLCFFWKGIMLTYFYNLLPNSVIADNADTKSAGAQCGGLPPLHGHTLECRFRSAAR